MALGFKRLMTEYEHECFRAAYECACELARRGYQPEVVHGSSDDFEK